MSDDITAFGEMTITFQGTKDWEGRLGLDVKMEVYPQVLLDDQRYRYILVAMLNDVSDKLRNTEPGDDE